MPRPRVYCIVYGCMNSTTIKPELSFFKLPSNAERRTRWLHVISREDLANKQPQHYTVCEEHFNTADILPGIHRKKLKANSFPSLQLPVSLKKDAQTSTEATFTDKCIQTESTVTLLASQNTQTPKSLSIDRNQTRKLKTKIIEYKNKIKSLESINHTKDQRQAFQKLCDRFLTKDLAELVKAETHSKFDNSGN